MSCEGNYYVPERQAQKSSPGLDAQVRRPVQICTPDRPMKGPVHSLFMRALPRRWKGANPPLAQETEGLMVAQRSGAPEGSALIHTRSEGSVARACLMQQ